MRLIVLLAAPGSHVELAHEEGQKQQDLLRGGVGVRARARARVRVRVGLG